MSGGERSRRWRLHETASPRRRRRGRVANCVGRPQVKKAKKKEEIRIAREKAEKRIAAALEANNAKQRRKREVFDAKQVEVGTRRPHCIQTTRI